MSFFFDDVADFFNTLGDRLRGENAERRKEDKIVEAEHRSTLTLGVQDKVKVVSVDLQPKENALKHHCDKYELVTRGKGTAIIRRGGAFTLEIELNEAVDLKKKQELTIYFSYGPNPLVNKGTQAVLVISGKKIFDKPHEEWDHRVASLDGKKAIIEIQVPGDVPVGVWMLAFQIKYRDDTSTSNRQLLRLDQLLYILFNPWSKHGSVYMEKEVNREEYVLNDVGKIWIGGYPTSRGRHWVFGQFDDAVLPACVILLEKSNLNPEQRGDPVMVARAISRIVNSNDDNGVLQGRWDGKYEDGTAPTKWTGSISILEEYIQKQRPVRYGQCWVFSGVTTTICRALGLPCRSISNMNSAHDTNMSLTIDKYFDKDGNEYKPRGVGVRDPEGFGDSIWNFHVWNDVYMARPDLPKGYGGWQAIDSTPQERSAGIFQCGPASLEAVRNGQSNLNFDVNFVLAEVNADVVHWQEDSSERDGYKKLTSDKSRVGIELYTKKPGKTYSDDRDKEDCTADYKSMEGTSEERVAINAAARRTRQARHAFRLASVADEDVVLSLVDVERVPIGDNFNITVSMKSMTKQKRTVTLLLSAASEFYTGVKANHIKKAEGVFDLNGGQEETLELPITYNEYFDKLVEYAMIKITAIANVEETPQTWIAEDTFQVVKPVINVEVLGEPLVDKPLPVKFSFINPLTIPLRNCMLVVDGPGLTRPKDVAIKDVPPKEEMTFEMNVFPKYDGTRSLVATFNSKELVDITGSATVEIKE